MKKFLLCSLLPLCTYASDATNEEVRRDRFQIDTEADDLLTKIESLSLDNNHSADSKSSRAMPCKLGPLQPKDFTDTGKKILMQWAGNCVTVAQQGGVPTDKGLVKMFVDMQQEGADKVINDASALRRANEYNSAYQISDAESVEWGIQQNIAPGKKNNFTFPDAQKPYTHIIHKLRAYAFYDIMYKRKEAPIVPGANFLLWYSNPADIANPYANLLELVDLLGQNTEASANLTPAIRGISILAAYYIQQNY